MSYTKKDWQDTPSQAPPLEAGALEDLETRVRSYLMVNGGAIGVSYTLALTNDAYVSMYGILTANATITVTGLTPGASFRMLLTQDATGSHTVRVSDGSTSVDVPILPTALSASVIDGFSPDGTTIYIVVQ
jgi:hypothetical protein